MSKHGWIALGLGTFFSLVIGCGLMALMFYSSRSGHDEAATPKFMKRRERTYDDTDLAALLMAPTWSNGFYLEPLAFVRQD